MSNQNARHVARTGKLTITTRDAVYPASRYPASELPNLGDLDERKRFTPAALRAFFSIMRHWEIRDEDARRLLGGVSNGTFYNWKNGLSKPLEQDRLLRISYLIGIFKSLNILFSRELADRWIRLPNSNAIFTSRTPLEYMLRDGAPAMDVVRRLLDARRGG